MSGATSIEPALRTIWTNALLLGVAGAVAWRLRAWAGAVVTVVALSFAWRLLARFTDPYVGPALLSEAGRGYLIQSYAAVAICLGLHVLGASLRLASRRRSRVERAT
jgi:hypothetical protein